MTLRPALLALALLLAAGCGGGGEEAATRPPPTAAPAPETAEGPGAFREATATIERAAGAPVELTVELAETQAQRERGLMGRASLPEDYGMVFLFEADTAGGFWMKNTLVPLSIAFADAGGRILAILDMEPCEADPCPIYDPKVTYRTALEVEQGAFSRWGVAVGDRLVVGG